MLVSVWQKKIAHCDLSTQAATNLTEIVIVAPGKKTKNWPVFGFYVHALSWIVATQLEKRLVFQEENTGL